MVLCQKGHILLAFSHLHYIFLLCAVSYEYMICIVTIWIKFHLMHFVCEKHILNVCPYYQRCCKERCWRWTAQQTLIAFCQLNDPWGHECAAHSISMGLMLLGKLNIDTIYVPNLWSSIASPGNPPDKLRKDQGTWSLQFRRTFPKTAGKCQGQEPSTWDPWARLWVHTAWCLPLVKAHIHNADCPGLFSNWRVRIRSSRYFINSYWIQIEDL